MTDKQRGTEQEAPMGETRDEDTENLEDEQERRG